MKLSMISISMLFTIVVTTICNYIEDAGGSDLMVIRCIAAVIAIAVFCMGLPSKNEYNAEERAY